MHVLVSKARSEGKVSNLMIWVVSIAAYPNTHATLCNKRNKTEKNQYTINSQSLPHFFLLFPGEIPTIQLSRRETIPSPIPRELVVLLPAPAKLAATAP